VSAYDVVIVGGGLIGASAAFELAKEKLRVLLLDRQETGREASWAAAGMLSPGPESAATLALVPLAKESFRLYPEFIDTVEEASRRNAAFVREGTLQVFPGPNGEGHREEMAAEYARFDLPIERISFEAARRLEASLGPAARVAAWLPAEAVADPRCRIDAVIAAGHSCGVEIRENCPVASVLRESSRCQGVIIATGEKIPAKHVIVAAGAYSAGIEWLSRFAPTRPIRGQMLALRSTSLTLGRVVRSERGYLVPRRDGRIIAGSTLEDSGFAKHLTPGGIRQILDAVLELVPGLADAEITETWAGLRPGTPDGLPILGPTDIEGLWVATGHYRNGILLAPATARLMRDWVLQYPLPVDTSAFSPLRFVPKDSKNRTAKGASIQS